MDVRLISLPGKRQDEPIQHHRFMMDRRRRLVDNGIEVYLHETTPRDDCLMRYDDDDEDDGDDEDDDDNDVSI